MAERKLIYDAYGTVIRQVIYDEHDPTKAFFNTICDYEPLAEQNKTDRENIDPKANLRHAARIPVTVVENAFREGWYHDKAAWKRFLNDPDNRAFRVWEGRL